MKHRSEPLIASAMLDSVNACHYINRVHYFNSDDLFDEQHTIEIQTPGPRSTTILARDLDTFDLPPDTTEILIRES